MIKKYGFTLVEVMVAITIAGIVLSSALVSYASLARTNQTIQIARQMQKELSFAVVRITDRIRSLPIAYDYYQDNYITVSSSEILALQQGMDQLFFEYDSGNQMLSMQEEPLFSSSFSVETVEFRISPSEDPSYITKPQVQSKISFFLRVRSKWDPSLMIQVQNTISSRLY